jgi:hypothetical protein
VGVQGVVFQKNPLAAGGIEVSGWAGRKLYIFFDFLPILKIKNAD